MVEFTKSTVLVLSGGIAIGMLSVDDKSPYRDLQQDGFAIAITSTGPTGPTGGNGGNIIQEQITGNLLAEPSEGRQTPVLPGKKKLVHVTSIYITDPSSGTSVST